MIRSCIPPPCSRLGYLRLAALASLWLGLSGGFARAENASPPEIPDRLDLQTAIVYALNHNFAIRQARERIREQEGIIVEVKALVLPNASINSFYTTNDRELSSDRGGGAAASTQNWQIALEVRQILYAGGGVRAALDAQRLVREAALLDLQTVVNDALFDVRARFYQVLLARERIAVEEESVQLLEEQTTNARNRFAAGASSNFEVLRAEVALANAQPALIRARNHFRTSIDLLLQAIGYGNRPAGEVGKVPELLGSLDFTPVSYELSQVLAAARENRPELQRLGKIEEAREVGIVIEKSNYRPNLALVGGYQLRKHNFSERFAESVDGWTVGLQSSWAIFDGRATAGRLAQARSRLEQAKLQTAESTIAVEVEARTALSSLQEAAELADAARMVVTQAEEALRLADARYSAGTATQLDVLQARVALTEARNNQLQANYGYNVALAALRRAMGQGDQFTVSG